MRTIVITDDEADVIHSALGGILLEGLRRAAAQTKIAEAKDNNVHAFLDISTGHLSEPAEEWLKSSSDAPRIIEHEHGWWMNIPSQPVKKSEDEDAPPTDILKLIEHARSLGCWWINFDADGDYLGEEFEMFER